MSRLLEIGRVFIPRMMAYVLWSIVVLLGILSSHQIAAYPDGKVSAACSTMEPVHGTTAQTSAAPYSLQVSKTNYTNGDKITVTLQNTTSQLIEGFLIQARSGSSTTPLGYFEISGSDVQTLKCTTGASAVSHTSGAQKSSVKVTWVAPNSNISDIQLRATVVASEKIYWLNVLGPKLTYAGSSGCRLLVPGVLSVLLICVLCLM
ncbi:putative ferric-chelate reductase 1 [Bombina bombina]|uniref:putative ferric-chelate reductase 1 n=1 Tax=Bombina bombina TaxID=8345 RepID=UPI00235A8A4B|nr:putative ferric-chelate reductase 1 [Bombina bombina]